MKGKNNFFTKVTTGLIHDLSKLFDAYGDLIGVDEVPCYIANTGDELYLSDMIGLVEAKTVYEQVPRATLSVGNIQPQISELSNGLVTGRFKQSIAGFQKEFSAHVRGVPLEITYTLQIVVENILQYYELVAVLLTESIFSRTFKIKYLGFDIPVICSLQDGFTPELNLELEHDNQSRNLFIELPVTTQVKFPAFDIDNADLKTSGIVNNFVWNTDLIKVKETNITEGKQQDEKEKNTFGCNYEPKIK